MYEDPFIRNLLFITLMILLLDAGFGIILKIKLMMRYEKVLLCTNDLEDCKEI